MKNTEKTLEKLVSLSKTRGFVFPGSEIYGGLANTWDYGPLGVEIKENIKKAWRKKFIQENKYNVGLDSAILMNPQTWVASGHLGGFSDPLMDCCECKTRHRADNLIEEFDGTNVAGWTNEQLSAYIEEHNIPCPTCGKHNFTDSVTAQTIVADTIDVRELRMNAMALGGYKLTIDTYGYLVVMEGSIDPPRPPEHVFRLMDSVTGAIYILGVANGRLYLGEDDVDSSSDSSSSSSDVPKELTVYDPESGYTYSVTLESGRLLISRIGGES